VIGTTFLFRCLNEPYLFGLQASVSIVDDKSWASIMLAALNNNLNSVNSRAGGDCKQKSIVEKVKRKSPFLTKSNTSFVKELVDPNEEMNKICKLIECKQ
jgi:hypothetical protein